MTRAAIALGSNLGRREEYLRAGIAGLRSIGDLVAWSPLYETAPVGGPEQGAYLNAVAVIETTLDPSDLLEQLHRIEAESERVREERWGPRTLDLDLILHGDSVVDGEGFGLQLPHPRYTERRFVLEPLLAAWPDATDPTGVDLPTVLRTLGDQDLTLVDADWLDQTEAVDRGGRWVMAQAVVLGAIVLAIFLGAGSFDAAPLRLVGLALAVGGAALGVGGIAALGRNLTPYPEPIDDGALVTVGSYRLVRHPLYGATVLVAAGMSLWAESVAGVLVTVAAVGFYRAKAGVEERRLEQVYEGYPAYMTRVRRRLIPWVL